MKNRFYSAVRVCVCVWLHVWTTAIRATQRHQFRFSTDRCRRWFHIGVPWSASFWASNWRCSISTYAWANFHANAVFSLQKIYAKASDTRGRVSHGMAVTKYTGAERTRDNNDNNNCSNSNNFYACQSKLKRNKSFAEKRRNANDEA